MSSNIIGFTPSPHHESCIYLVSDWISNNLARWQGFSHELRVFLADWVITKHCNSARVTCQQEQLPVGPVGELCPAKTRAVSCGDLQIICVCVARSAETEKLDLRLFVRVTACRVDSVVMISLVWEHFVHKLNSKILTWPSHFLVYDCLIV